MKGHDEGFLWEVEEEHKTVKDRTETLPAVSSSNATFQGGPRAERSGRATGDLGRVTCLSGLPAASPNFERRRSAESDLTSEAKS